MYMVYDTVISNLSFFCTKDIFTDFGKQTTSTPIVDISVCSWEVTVTHPLQRVNTRVVFSSLKMLGKETVWNRCELLVTWVPLTFVPGITHFGNTQPFILSDLGQLPLKEKETIKAPLLLLVWNLTIISRHSTSHLLTGLNKHTNLEIWKLLLNFGPLHTILLDLFLFSQLPVKTRIKWAKADKATEGRARGWKNTPTFFPCASHPSVYPERRR